MPAIRQKWITRADVRANRDVLYLFGDNEERRGLGGQAKEMRGESNAIGVRTKRSPSTHEDAFWSDDKLYQGIAMIDEDLKPAFRHLDAGGIVVIPMDGLGTGLSELPARAPAIYAHLEKRIQEMLAYAP